MASKKLIKVVQRCLSEVARSKHLEHLDVYVGEDLSIWYIALHYPAESPFRGGPGGDSLEAHSFSLYAKLQFTEDFPAKPPKLKFLSKWDNHQHLWGDRICHSLLSDDFLDFFAERRTHGTSMWNAACALADSESVGGMPRYLQVLRDFLSHDLDYDEEQHVKYDAEKLAADVRAQQATRPSFLDDTSRLELASSGGESMEATTTGPDSSEAQVETSWGTDFFSKAALIAGELERHPCFDVEVVMQGRRLPALSTTMTTVCRSSFEDGACTTDFGTRISALMPFPCSRKAWASAGAELALATMAELSSVANFYALQLPSCTGDAMKLETYLGILGEIWRAMCITIMTGDGHESERAMLCFVTLHFLLLCLAEDCPELPAHAVATVQEFISLVRESPAKNVKTSVPDLGRFLVRFLLTPSGGNSLQECAKDVVRELFRRNVRWVPQDYWADPDSDEKDKEEEVSVNFEKSQFGMKLIIFQSYYILRSQELGLNTIEALEQCSGMPPAEALRTFQQDCREIKQCGSFQEFFLWLQLDEWAAQDVHPMLCSAVEESEACGYNAGLVRT